MQWCNGAAIKAPCSVFVLLQETTRGSAKKQFDYEVKVSPIKKCERPVGLPFEGTFSTSATKVPVKELVEMHASASKAKKKCKASSKASKQTCKK
jgi:hypothetical protein